jgi:hypothetical protein
MVIVQIIDRKISNSGAAGTVAGSEFPIWKSSACGSLVYVQPTRMI